MHGLPMRDYMPPARYMGTEAVLGIGASEEPEELQMDSPPYVNSRPRAKEIDFVYSCSVKFFL